MGNIFTKPEAVLLDWNAERIGYSKRANTTDWCYPDQPKNFDYWFSEELGFVKMNYKNYGNQTLQIELIQIIEK